MSEVDDVAPWTVLVEVFNERTNDCMADSDRAPRCLRLRRPVRDRPSSLRGCLRDAEAAFAEIDVGKTQGSEFSGAQSGESTSQHECSVAGVNRGGQIVYLGRLEVAMSGVAGPSYASPSSTGGTAGGGGTVSVVVVVELPRPTAQATMAMRMITPITTNQIVVLEESSEEVDDPSEESPPEDA